MSSPIKQKSFLFACSFCIFHFYFPETASCKSGGIDLAADEAKGEIHLMSIPKFIDSLADFNKLTHDVTNVIDNVRTTVVKRVIPTFLPEVNFRSISDDVLKYRFTFSVIWKIMLSLL